MFQISIFIIHHTSLDSLNDYNICYDRDTTQVYIAPMQDQNGRL